MRIERFYLDAEFKENMPIFLEGTEHHHGAHVLRLTLGDSIELVNGRGALARAEILSVGKDQMKLRITQLSHSPSLPYRIAAAIPLMRPSKLEWVIEKGTELGADSFLLYLADYSEKENLSSHQLERLRAITISAIKQSRRTFLPPIEILPSLAQLLSKEARFYFGDLTSDAPYFHREAVPYSIFISGPEKGFSREEHLLLTSKANGQKLSPHVLRAETAPLAALTLFFAS